MSSGPVRNCITFFLGAPEINIHTESSGVCGVLKKNISDITNPRLARMCEKMLHYILISEHIEGAKNSIADYYSMKLRFRELYSVQPMSFQLIPQLSGTHILTQMSRSGRIRYLRWLEVKILLALTGGTLGWQKFLLRGRMTI